METSNAGSPETKNRTRFCKGTKKTSFAML